MTKEEALCQVIKSVISDYINSNIKAKGKLVYSTESFEATQLAICNAYDLLRTAEIISTKEGT